MIVSTLIHLFAALGQWKRRPSAAPEPTVRATLERQLERARVAISAEFDQSDNYGRRSPLEEANIAAQERSIVSLLDQLGQLRV